MIVLIETIVYYLAVALTLILLYTACGYVVHSIASFFYRIDKRELKERPKVAIVIPTYNETVIKETVETMLRTITYDNYVIIIVDDSDNEECRKIVDSLKCDKVIVLRRGSREGFKGGALAYAHEFIKKLGIKYYYVFDADWVPQPDFIERSLPYIMDKDVGYVQLCRRFRGSLLEMVPSVAIEAAYIVDLPARQVLGEWLLITGSGSLVKVEAVDKAGGWRGHLTEDIDLSIRMTLAGYRGVYLRDVEIYGSEAPSSLFKYLKQQLRWAKGTIQCIKYLPAMFSKDPVYGCTLLYQIMMFLGGAIIFILFVLDTLFLWLYRLCPVIITNPLPLNQIAIFYLFASILPVTITYMRCHRDRLYLLPLSIFYVWNTLVSQFAAVIKKEATFYRTPKRIRSGAPLDMVVIYAAFVIVLSLYTMLGGFNLFTDVYWAVVISPVVYYLLGLFQR